LRSRQAAEAEGLREMLPRLAIYVIAFYIIANHWVVHQRD
jgi:uncharacterized membrane protein